MELVTILWSLVSNPTVGLPLFVLVAASAIWVLRGTPRPRITAGFEEIVPAPDRDPVSRTYIAIHRGTYSEVVRQVYWRLDAALVRRCQFALTEIPWRRSVAERRGVPNPRDLVESRIALDTLHIWASQLESETPLRRDFWRTVPASRAVFLRRLADRLAIVDGQLWTLTHTP